MSSFEPRDPAWETKVRDSFARQGIMKTLGASLVRVAPGEVDIAVPYHDGLSQQHGYFHAGVTSTIVDSAGGYAAFSLFPPETLILTVEFKINLLAPAHGEELRACGKVVKPGRNLTVCDGEVYVLRDGAETLCAKMQQTLMRLDPRPDGPQAG